MSGRTPGNQGYDYLIKLMLIGDSGVGKSSLLLRFSDDTFDISGTPTIGIDFKLRTIDVDGKKVKLQLLDTAGQERFRTITTAHYRNAMGILLVYDITNEQSFENIAEWLQNIDKHTTGKVDRVLIGNKIDMDEKRVRAQLERGTEKSLGPFACNFCVAVQEVPTKRGEELAKQLGIDFFETSAKADTDVDKAFHALTRQIKAKMEAQQRASTPAAGGAQAVPAERVSVASAGGAADKKKCCN